MGDDFRNADPEQLEELANRLEGFDGGSGVAANCQQLFNRAADVDALAVLGPLRPLQTWASEMASGLRDRAAVLRGEHALSFTAGQVSLASALDRVRASASALPFVSGGGSSGPMVAVSGGLGDDSTGENSPPNGEENAGDGAEYDYVPWPDESAFLAEHEEAIEEAAEEYDIDKVTLTALLIKEGSGRSLWADMMWGPGIIFRPIEANGPYFGRNQTVGIAQMRPDVAQRLIRDNYGVEVSERDARILLTMDDEWAIRLAAAELDYLKQELSITDRQAYVAYAGGADQEVTQLWLDDAPRERAPLLYEREDGASEYYEQAEEYWERADSDDEPTLEDEMYEGGDSSEEGST